MTDLITCPNCKTKLRKGSTFCLKCGTALDGKVTKALAHDIGEHEDVSLPELEDWSDIPDDTDPLMAATLAAVGESESMLSSSEVDEPEVELPPAEDLSWDEGMETVSSSTSDESKQEVELEDSILEDESLQEESDTEMDSETHPSSRDLSWDTPEDYSSEIKVGMPFKEVAPPKIIDTETKEVSEAREHLITEAPDEPTREAVTHLFPHGRGDTTSDFIENIVGKPKKIGAEISPVLLETPTCPDCGATIGSDSFEYPSYVYEAMGKARMDYGAQLMKELDHENAIEQFEIAKKLFEHGDIKKMVEEATKQVDEGYDAMAEHHFIQGENHLKEKQYEWAIVQFKKARELYMFSTDAKKRAKCSQRARDAYEEWGKDIEDEGDQLSKAGQTRDALAKYSEAAEKYREADNPKKLRGLEKKIKKA